MAEKILIVDDEKAILDLAAIILRNRGYQTLVAENALDGLALIEKEGPALVLLDYMMPAMDGMSALKLIRHHFPQTYVVMFTGRGSEAVAVELMKAGASDYVQKPFNNQDLVERIEHVLRLRRSELQNRELREERERLLRQIEEWNRELERRVAEKTRQLEEAHAEIVLGEKLVSLGHLAAGMAHEIRNPLNSISLFAQILKSSGAPQAEVSSYAEKILQEIERIDDILVKVLATSKRPRVDLQLVSVATAIEEVVEKMAPQLQAQQIAVRRELHPGAPPVVADAGEIEQIFTNLLSNALHAMPQGGEISITLSHDTEALHIEVADSGSGIPPEILPKIFEPFFTTKTKGTGFGLSVVLRIVKTYHGRISVESTPDVGSIFRIRLPLPNEVPDAS